MFAIALPNHQTDFIPARRTPSAIRYSELPVAMPIRYEYKKLKNPRRRVAPSLLLNRLTTWLHSSGVIRISSIWENSSCWLRSCGKCLKGYRRAVGRSGDRSGGMGCPRPWPPTAGLLTCRKRAISSESMRLSVLPNNLRIPKAVRMQNASPRSRYESHTRATTSSGRHLT